jgi:hypothetical protein
MQKAPRESVSAVETSAEFEAQIDYIYSEELPEKGKGNNKGGLL